MSFRQAAEVLLQDHARRHAFGSITEWTSSIAQRPRSRQGRNGSRSPAPIYAPNCRTRGSRQRSHASVVASLASDNWVRKSERENEIRYDLVWSVDAGRSTTSIP